MTTFMVFRLIQYFYDLSVLGNGNPSFPSGKYGPKSSARDHHVTTTADGWEIRQPSARINSDVHGFEPQPRRNFSGPMSAGLYTDAFDTSFSPKRQVPYSAYPLVSPVNPAFDFAPMSAGVLHDKKPRSVSQDYMAQNQMMRQRYGGSTPISPVRRHPANDMTADPNRSALLEEFRNNKMRKFELRVRLFISVESWFTE